MRPFRLLFTALLFIFCLVPALAQHALKGRVYDRDTRKPLRDVIVLYNFGNQQVPTDSSGRFTIANRADHSPLLFKKLGYSSYRLVIENDSTEQPPVAVFMSKKDVNLEEVEITAEKVSPMVKNKSFYIDDYFILPDNKYLLVTEYLGEKGFNLALADQHNKILCQKTFVNEDAGEFFLDCVGNIHLLTRPYARQIVNTSDTSFSTLDAVPRADFDKVVMPCSARIDKSYFFTKYNDPSSFVREGVKVNVNSNVALVYKVENHKTDNMKLITYDKRVMEMYRHEVEYQNAREGLSQLEPLTEGVKTRSPSGVGGGSTGLKYSPNDILIAYQAIFRKIYAPLYTRHDTIVLFDFSDEEIDLYDAPGNCIKKTPINAADFSEYHEFQILSDRVTGKLYLLNKKTDGEYLHEININTGALFNETKIRRPLGRRVQVYDDDIYYILKEHDWDDTSYLYRQRQ